LHTITSLRIYRGSAIMTLTEQQIKVRALTCLLKEREVYLAELRAREAALQNCSEIIHRTNSPDEMLLQKYACLKDTLEETQQQIPLIDSIIRKIATDIDKLVKNKNSGTIERLLSEAGAIVASTL
jgi:hypothetical protein